MDREGFRSRLKQYKEARGLNPLLKYWEWKELPEYENGTGSVATDEETLRSNIQRAIHTTPEGELNPFYNSLDDTYGTFELPEVVVTAPYTRKASLAQQAREGAAAYYKAGRKAAPVLAAIPLGAAGLAAASTLGWSATSNILDIAANPTDPLTYIDKFKRVGLFIDSGFTPASKILNQSDNTLTRYVGTGDSGYKDALISGVIRGNMTPATFSAHLLKKLNDQLKDKLSEADLRSLNSNNITQENFDRINNALQSISSKGKVGKVSIGKNYTLGKNWDDFLLKQLEDQNLFRTTVGLWSLNRSPEINDWIANWDGHNLATFARENEILDNKLLFPGDYAVQIKNADKWERTATHLGHFPEHKITYKPVEFDNSDVTWYKRKDGLFSKKKYMIEVPKDKVLLDWRRYNAEAYGFAEGGEVEQEHTPEEILARSRYQVNGIPINDQPLSGTDPIGEAVMWGLGGGAASAALRKIFPTYGAMAGWLAFGDNGKENMLVIPNDPTKKRGPIADNLINKEVKDYYANDVIPRDVVHTSNQSFITDDNFMYDILPEEEFNPGVAGYYNKLNDKIAINNRYAGDKKALDDVMVHEVDHLYNNQYPLDKQHNNILNRAYTVQDDDISRAARAARKESEKRATNKNVRYGLYTELKERLGRTPSIKEVDEYIDSIPDLELLDRLYRANSYGAAYVMSIEDRAELLKAPINQYKKTRATLIRKALKLIAMNESNQELNYA